jgi:hypothetical protein
MMEITARTVGQYPRHSPADKARQQAQERGRRIKFLKYVLMGLMTLDEAARALQISDSTMDRTKKELLEDGAQDTDDLRKLATARKHWRENK